MARIRTIKPDACLSESLAEMDEATCWTFALMWTQCDDAGRWFSNPSIVRGAVAPLRPEVTDDVIRDRLARLREGSHICLYVGCDGKKYLHVTGWDHQKIDRPSVSRIPPCRDHEPAVTCAFHPDDPSECHSTEQPRESLASPREPSASVSRILDLGPRIVDHGPGTTDLAPTTSSREVASTRRADPIWDALMAACQIDTTSLTAAARGSYNAARKQLADVGATPDEINQRAANYRSHFPNAPLTPPALAKQWAQCATAATQRGRPSTTDAAVNSALALAAKYAQEEL